MFIKLVKYWDKYTEMHGQQNVKILQNSRRIILPNKPSSSQWPLSLRFTRQNYVRISLPPHEYHTLTPPSSLIWATSVRLEVQIIKIFTVQFSPVSCQFLLLSPQHLPQHLVLESSYATFFPSISVSQPSRARGQLQGLILRICATPHNVDVATFDKNLIYSDISANQDNSFRNHIR